MPDPHAHTTTRGTGLWLILVTLLSWASIPLFLRAINTYGVDPFSANGWRYGISALFWLPYLVFLATRSRLPKALFVAALVPTAFNILGQSAFAWGPTLLEPGFFSFIFRVQIIFVTLGAYLLFPVERAILRSPRYWLGVALVAAGSIGLFLFRDAPPPPLAGVTDTATTAASAAADTFWLGVAVALASGVLFAGYGLSVRYYVSKYDPVPAFGVICQFTAIGVIAVMLLLGKQHGACALGMTAPQWGILIASSFIGIAVSHVTYYASLKRLGVSLTSGIIQLQPVLTAAASMLVFDERLNAPQWASGIVGVSGALLMLTATPAKPAKQATAEAEGS